MPTWGGRTQEKVILVKHWLHMTELLIYWFPCLLFNSHLPVEGNINPFLFISLFVFTWQCKVLYPLPLLSVVIKKIPNPIFLLKKKGTNSLGNWNAFEISNSIHVGTLNFFTHNFYPQIPTHFCIEKCMDSVTQNSQQKSTSICLRRRKILENKSQCLVI